MKEREYNFWQNIRWFPFWVNAVAFSCRYCFGKFGNIVEILKKSHKFIISRYAAQGGLQILKPTIQLIWNCIGRSTHYTLALVTWIQRIDLFDAGLCFIMNTFTQATWLVDIDKTCKYSCGCNISLWIRFVWTFEFSPRFDDWRLGCLDQYGEKHCSCISPAGSHVFLLYNQIFKRYVYIMRIFIIFFPSENGSEFVVPPIIYWQSTFTHDISLKIAFIVKQYAVSIQIVHALCK